MKKFTAFVLVLMYTCILCSCSLRDEIKNDPTQSQSTKPTTATAITEAPEKQTLRQDPFLWINERTTEADIISTFGEPIYDNDGSVLVYEDFPLYGEVGELWFQFRGDILGEAGFSNEYPGRKSWKSKEVDDKYTPTAEEQVAAQDYALLLKEIYLSAYGDYMQEIRTDRHYGWRWRLSSDFYEGKLELLTSFDDESPIEIYYCLWEK